jgi:hypothetical protein
MCWRHYIWQYDRGNLSDCGYCSRGQVLGNLAAPARALGSHTDGFGGRFYGTPGTLNGSGRFIVIGVSLFHYVYCTSRYQPIMRMVCFGPLPWDVIQLCTYPVEYVHVFIQIHIQYRLLHVIMDTRREDCHCCRTLREDDKSMVYQCS